MSESWFLVSLYENNVEHYNKITQPKMSCKLVKNEHKMIISRLICIEILRRDM